MTEQEKTPRGSVSAERQRKREENERVRQDLTAKGWKTTGTLPYDIAEEFGDDPSVESPTPTALRIQVQEYMRSVRQRPQEYIEQHTRGVDREVYISPELVVEITQAMRRLYRKEGN